MIKRTLEISQQPLHVTARDEQLLLLRKDDAPQRLPANPENLAASVPCEDVGVLIVEHAGTTFSHAALERLASHGAAVVLCGRDHLPAGMLLPVGEHTQVVHRVRDQLAAARPLRKQLWRQLVQAKIRAQATNLLAGSSSRSKLLGLARSVRSGDPGNVEAHAARVYWKVWLEHGAGGVSSASSAAPPSTEFHRDPGGPPPNNLLNYGYAVLRAAVARAIVAAGLLPMIGLKHGHRANYFCLADDLLEPLRPMADARVRELHLAGESDLTPAVKKALLELLVVEVRCGEAAGPLMVGLHRYVASLVDCFEGSARRLLIPMAEPGAGQP